MRATLTELETDVERVAGVSGPWSPIACPPDDARVYLTGPSATVLGVTAAGARAEDAGLDHAHADGNPLAVHPSIAGPPFRVWPATRPPAASAWASLVTSLRAHGTRTDVRRIGEHLRALEPTIDPGRALGRQGYARGRIDRLLAQRVSATFATGPCWNVDRAFVRTVADGTTRCLRARRYARDGVPLRDALAWTEGALERTDLGDAWAHRLVALSLALRDAAHDDPTRRGNALAHLDEMLDTYVPAREPSRVAVTVVGPSWLDVRALVGDGSATPAHARRLISQLEGVVVDGVALRVETQPFLTVRQHAEPRTFAPSDAGHTKVFTRWNEGIRADDEGLFSATPEVLAMQIARTHHGVVIDGTTGIGCLAIALARQPEVTRVIAVDTHAGRLAMARANAAVYGVGDRITFVQGDVREVLARRDVHADGLVLDPPWGGRDWDRARMTVSDLGMDVAGVLAVAPARVTVKLPLSFATESLGADFAWRLMLDDRGRPKFVVADRAR